MGTTSFFSGSGSWTVPIGVSSITIEVWGGGGGTDNGSGAASNGLGGGGAGGYSQKANVGVTGGTTSVSYSVGAGGTANSGTGNTGGITTATIAGLGITMAGNGGVGGSFTSGGAGGTGAGGTTNTNGGSGANAPNGHDGGNGGAAAGAGGAGSGGAGGLGGFSGNTGHGQVGVVPGGGGGGAGANNFFGSTGSGAGAAGLVTFSWNNVYNDTATGGVVAGGLCINRRILTKTATGGVVVGGTAINKNIISGSGGAVCSGTSIVRKRTSIIATGGVVGGGSSTQKINAKNIATGGTLAGGSSTIRIITNKIASGGVVASGGALLSAGGVKCGGRCIVSVNILANGGIKAGGTCINREIMRQIASGGVKAGGSSRLSAIPFISGTINGVSIWTGAANKIAKPTSTGGVVVSGTARRTATINASGTVNGVSSWSCSADSIFVGIPVYGSGEIDGASTWTTAGNKRCNITASNGVKCGGSAINHVIASGSGTIAGISSWTCDAESVFVGIPVYASGTIDGVSSWSCSANKRSNIKATGGASCSGTAKLSCVFKKVASGGIVCNSTAPYVKYLFGSGTINGVSSWSCGGNAIRSASGSINGSSDWTGKAARITTPLITGGVVIGGTSTKKSVWHLLGSSGAIVGGVARNTARLGASGTINGVSSWSCIGSYQPPALNIQNWLAPQLSCKLFPVSFPNKPIYPSIVYGRTATKYQYYLDGVAELSTSHYSFDIYSKTEAMAEIVGDELKSALNGFFGTIGNVDIKVIQIMNVSTDYFDDDGFNQRGLIRTVEVEIDHMINSNISNFRYTSEQDIRQVIANACGDLVTYSPDVRDTRPLVMVQPMEEELLLFLNEPDTFGYDKFSVIVQSKSYATSVATAERIRLALGNTVDSIADIDEWDSRKTPIYECRLDLTCERTVLTSYIAGIGGGVTGGTALNSSSIPARGGIKAGGSSINRVIRSYVATGGCVVAGIGRNIERDSNIASGGAKCGGRALATGKILNNIASGGVIVGVHEYSAGYNDAFWR